MPHLPFFMRLLLEEPKALTALTESALGDAKKAHKRIHDHLAGVMDSAIKPVHGEESARLVADAEAYLDEAGKAIAQQHAVRLAKAHDEAAKQTGMDCEGAYNSALNIPDAPDLDDVTDPDDPNAGDPKPGESAHSNKGEKTLTEEEMIAALKSKGFAVEAPKTTDDKVADLERRLAEQDERIKQLTESSNPPQRKTEVLGSGLEETSLKPEEIYQEGDYLRGDLAPKNWKALANRKVPWPKDMDPAVALHELAPFLAYRLLDTEASASGRDLSMVIGPHENI